MLSGAIKSSMLIVVESNCQHPTIRKMSMVGVMIASIVHDNDTRRKDTQQNTS